ncbi:MAG TPA: sugar phosphate isomerase/epimerase family protein [Candidatus Solibacter sp.]|nr:sugar phosphate isomerase/epimerase family protein [Candidatus Solibacter sp.]
MPITRRQFTAASAALLAARRLSAAAGPALQFPTAPRDRLAIASYSLRTMLSRGRGADSSAARMDISEFPAYAVKRFGVRNLEILGQHLRSTDAPYLDEFRRAVTAAGARVINIPTSVGASLYDPDAAKRTVAVENSKKWIDAAIALDCPSVRIHIQRAGNTTPDVDRTAEALSGVAQYGASKSVVVNLENDDLVTEDAFFIVKVIDKVNSPWLRALPDFCNSMLKGDEAFNYDAVKAMFARAYNISHLKDSEVDHGKVFRIDLARTFEIAKAAGYKGYFSVEFEGEGDAVVGTEKLIAGALKYLG